MSECKGCKWWLEKYSDDGDYLHMGECHRYPPIPFRSSNDADVRKINASCTFPITAKDSFCGEFKEI